MSTSQPASAGTQHRPDYRPLAGNDYVACAECRQPWPCPKAAREPHWGPARPCPDCGDMLPLLPSGDPGEEACNHIQSHLLTHPCICDDENSVNSRSLDCPVHYPELLYNPWVRP